jgi:hypothetical protein
MPLHLFVKGSAVEAEKPGIFLIGGGMRRLDFGDYLQLKSTVDLYSQIGNDFNFFLLCEARHHQELKIGEQKIIPLYYDMAETATDLGLSGDLVPFQSWPHLSAVHVYGADFSNTQFEQATATLASALFDRCNDKKPDGQQRLFVSGLHVSPALASHWSQVIARATYVGARDVETLSILKGMAGHGAAHICYSGDDALPELVDLMDISHERERNTQASIAVYVECPADRTQATLFIERTAKAFRTVAEHLPSEATCEFLLEAAEGYSQINAIEDFEVAPAGAGTQVTPRCHDLLKQALEGAISFESTFLITSSFHVALMGLLHNCSTLLLIGDASLMHKAAGLHDSHQSGHFAVMVADDLGGVPALFAQNSNAPYINPVHAMLRGQIEKGVRVARACAEMRYLDTLDRLTQTAGAFRNVSADLGELRRRLILQESLRMKAAKNKETRLRQSYSRYLSAEYWQNRPNKLLRSLKKRI